MKKLFRTFLFTGLLIAAAGAAQAASGPVAVTVSIPPQKYFVEAVGKEDVAVTVMTGKGRDPHSYEPTAAQMAGISRTEVYIAVGVPFESQWLPKFTSLNPSMLTVFLAEHIERLKGKPDLALRDSGGSEKFGGKEKHGAHDDHGHSHNGHAHEGHHHHHGLEGDDPHIWLSPKVMADTIPVIVEALSQARPEKAGIFRERGNALVEATRRLDAEIAAMFAPLPANGRTFLTFHQGWAYYAYNYGLREAAVELGGREVGAKSMALLLDFAKKNNIKVIVSDPMTSKSALAAVAKSIKAEVLTATPLEEDWPSSMRAFSLKLAEAMRN